MYQYHSLTFISVILVSSSPFANDPVAEPPPITTLTLNAANNLTIIIHSNGNYQVHLNGSDWLHSSATFFHSRGKMYSTQGGSLHLNNFGKVESGWDNLGSYSSVSIGWKMNDCDFESRVFGKEPVAEPPPCTPSSVVTTFRAYKLSPLIVFSQVC